MQVKYRIGIAIDCELGLSQNSPDSLQTFSLSLFSSPANKILVKMPTFLFLIVTLTVQFFLFFLSPSLTLFFSTFPFSSSSSSCWASAKNLKNQLIFFPSGKAFTRCQFFKLMSDDGALLKPQNAPNLKNNFIFSGHNRELDNLRSYNQRLPMLLFRQTWSITKPTYHKHIGLGPRNTLKIR